MTWEPLPPVNGRSRDRLHIGDLVLRDPGTFTNYTETAAGDHAVRVPPGRYPVYALRDCGRPWHSLLCDLPGVVAFPNSYLGLKGGESTSVTLNLRAYAVAREVAAKISAVELRPGVEVRRCEDGTYDLYFGDYRL